MGTLHARSVCNIAHGGLPHSSSASNYCTYTPTEHIIIIIMDRSRNIALNQEIKLGGTSVALNFKCKQSEDGRGGHDMSTTSFSLSCSQALD